MKNKIITAIIALFLLVSLANVSALDITSVSSSQSEIIPGTEVQVTINIENNFDDNVENVKLSLDLANLPFAPSDSGIDKSIEKIKDDDSELISFNLKTLPDAKAGVYKIPVKIIYDRNEVVQQETSLISLTISPKPELRVEYEDSLIKGQENKLVVKVINSGLGDAKFLSLTIGQVSGIKVFGSKTIYIGDVDSDDFQSSEFKIFIDASASKTINLPVTLEYKDSNNKEYTQEENLLITAYTKDEAIQLGLINKSNTAVYAGIAIVLIMIYIIYRVIKARRRKNKLKEKI